MYSFTRGSKSAGYFLARVRDHIPDRVMLSDFHWAVSEFNFISIKILYIYIGWSRDLSICLLNQGIAFQKNGSTYWTDSSSSSRSLLAFFSSYLTTGLGITSIYNECCVGLSCFIMIGRILSPLYCSQSWKIWSNCNRGPRDSTGAIGPIDSSPARHQRFPAVDATHCGRQQAPIPEGRIRSRSLLHYQTYDCYELSVKWAWWNVSQQNRGRLVIATTIS